MKEVIDRLDKECYKLQEFLSITTSNEPEELVVRLSELNVWLARSVIMLAEAKQVQDIYTYRAYREYIDGAVQLPASALKKYVESQLYDVNYLVNRLDRLNAACVHIGDNIRTQISYAKEELKLTRTGY